MSDRDIIEGAWTIPLPELAMGFEKLRAEKERLDSARREIGLILNAIKPTFIRRLEAEQGANLLVVGSIAWRKSQGGEGLERLEIDWVVKTPPGAPPT